ncbi:hypothetical protein DFJ77DRAFT_550445 [Powellomyces hirtus]|nr:hypothetical protein DFJ77DRAFT_550445 [Powellomyces hirtus]
MSMPQSHKIRATKSAGRQEPTLQIAIYEGPFEVDPAPVMVTPAAPAPAPPFDVDATDPGWWVGVLPKIERRKLVSHHDHPGITAHHSHHGTPNSLPTAADATYSGDAEITLCSAGFLAIWFLQFLDDGLNTIPVSGGFVRINQFNEIFWSGPLSAAIGSDAEDDEVKEYVTVRMARDVYEVLLVADSIAFTTNPKIVEVPEVPEANLLLGDALQLTVPVDGTIRLQKRKMATVEDFVTFKQDARDFATLFAGGSSAPDV